MPQLKFIKEKDTTIYPITIPQGVITDVENKKNLADSLGEKVDKENGAASNLTVTPVSGGSTALTANGNVEFGNNTSNGEGSKLVLKTGTNSACQITLESDTDGKDPSINFSYGTDHSERGLSITGYTSTYPQGVISLNSGGMLKFPEFTGEDTFARKSEVDSKADSSAIPTKTSQLTNDSGYLTSHQDISGKVDKENGTATNLTVQNNADSSALTIKANGYSGIKIVPRQPYNDLSPRARIMYEGKDSYIDIPTLQSGNDTLALQSQIQPTDTTLSSSSTNPIANKAVKEALDKKVDSSNGTVDNLTVSNNLNLGEEVTYSGNTLHSSSLEIIPPNETNGVVLSLDGTTSKAYEDQNKVLQEYYSSEKYINEEITDEDIEAEVYSTYRSGSITLTAVEGNGSDAGSAEIYVGRGSKHVTKPSISRIRVDNTSLCGAGFEYDQSKGYTYINPHFEVAPYQEVSSQLHNYYEEGNSYNIFLPQNEGTLALTSDIPTTVINSLSTWSGSIIHGSGDYIVVDKDLSSLTGSGMCVLKSLNKFSKDSGYSSTDSVDTSYANQMRVGTRILTAADSTTGYCMVGTIIAAYTQYTNVDGQQKFATGKYLAAVGSNNTNVNDICNLVLLVPKVSSLHRYAYQIFNLWDLTKISSLEEQLSQLSTRVSTLEGSGS